MILTNEFTVDAPIERVWALLDEMEAIVPCMPGASHIGREGDEHRVGIRMKVGAIATNFQGVVRFVERDPAAHTAVIKGQGKDAGGKASASATVTTQLQAQSAAVTRVLVKTDLAITGRLAQFGGGVLADISSRLIAQFAANLQRTMLSRPYPLEVGTESAPILPSPAADTAAPSAPEPAALDLGSVMAPAAWNMVRRYVLVPATFFALGWLAARYL